MGVGEKLDIFKGVIPLLIVQKSILGRFRALFFSLFWEKADKIIIQTDEYF